MTIQLKVLQENDWCDAASLATGITATLIEATKLSNIKPKKSKSRLLPKNPWFDKECQKVKKSLRR